MNHMFSPSLAVGTRCWITRTVLYFLTREPRGFGFVKFRYAEDAAEAKQQMNHRIIGGREVRIVFAEENRKTPQEMRISEGMRYT